MSLYPEIYHSFRNLICTSKAHARQNPFKGFIVCNVRPLCYRRYEFVKKAGHDFLGLTLNHIFISIIHESSLKFIQSTRLKLHGSNHRVRIYQTGEKKFPARKCLMSDMVEVVVDSLRVSLTNQQRIVVLREVGVERYLPIWIGPYEAESITIALQEIEVARPQTHDLLKNFLIELNARLIRVEVSSLADDVFYGNLVIEANNQIIDIDSRPSDALALAVRSHVPILVAREVMDKAGIIPEKDTEPENESSNSIEYETDESPADNADRLSIFEDFLDKLETNDDTTDDPPDEDNSEVN